MAIRKNRIVGTLGMVLFAAGVLAAMVLWGITIWGDLEAALFSVNLRGDASLSTLRCPVIMSAHETATVSAAFKNPLERPIEYTIRTHISHGYLTMVRQIDERLPLAPGERQRLAWPVTAADVVYGRLVLAKVYLFGQYPFPSRQGSCGILVLDLPFLTGNQAFALALVLALLALAGGAWLWGRANWPLRGGSLPLARAMGTLLLILLVGLVVALLGWWLIGVLFFAIALLLIVTVVLQAEHRQRRARPAGPAR